MQIMEPVSRKVVYRLYPSRSQQAALLDMLGSHQRLYNAALEQRIAAWRLQHKSLSAYDQMRDLTDLRAADERYGALNAQSAQVTLNRLHLAFAAFFGRCKRVRPPASPGTYRSTVSAGGDTRRTVTASGSRPPMATETASCASRGSARFRCAAGQERWAMSRPARFNTRPSAGMRRSRFRANRNERAAAMRLAWIGASRHSPRSRMRTADFRLSRTRASSQA